VSSILRALKKLEDRPADAAGAPPWREKFASEHARHSRPSSAPWRSRPVIAAGAVVLLAAGWMATHRPSHKAETTPEVIRTERPVAAAQNPSRGAAGTPAPAAAGAPSASPTRSTDAAPGDAPNAFVERMRLAQQERREALEARRKATPGVTPPAGLASAVPAPAPQRPVARNPAKAAVSAPEPQAADAEPDANAAAPATPDRREPPPDRPALPTRTAAATPTTPVTASPRALAAPAPRSPSAVPAQRPPGTAPSPPQQGPTEKPEPILTRLRDDAVKLQAVAWSNDPERRMAVINEQVVREGYTIEGYTIATIREESVVVRKGAESWELRYGH